MNANARGQVAHDELIARWARAGAGFNVPPAPSSEQSPDLERLLLETARQARGDSRVFIMAASWLARYATLIAKHRLRAMIVHELEPSHRAALGLLLDIVHHKLKTDRFNGAIRACADSIPSVGEPLFDVESRSEVLRRIARDRAMQISLRWNRWVADFEFKEDAIRPPLWVMQQNPEYVDRAEFKGDLRASILIEIRNDAEAGASEQELARRCGATRPAVRAALAGLELAKRIDREHRGVRHAAMLSV
jgi:hypothetical protein